MRSVFMRYPDGKAGVPQDKRPAEMFDKYGRKGTFNFNCEGLRNANFTKEQIKESFLSQGHEIAVHGAMHRANGNTRVIEGIRAVLDCRLELEAKCECIIRGMAYPDTGIQLFGNLGNYEQVKQYLKELDIAYSRTLGGDNNLFMLPNDFYAWMPTAHHNNPKIMEYIDEFLKLDISVKSYHATRVPRLFYIWGHSYEFDSDGNWECIEKICCKLANNDEIWYATNIEIYDYVHAYKSLIYSADGHPSYRTWLNRDMTTMFEHWDARESKNHHMLSDVMSWMTKYILGIKQPKDSVGFKKVEICPNFFEGLNYAKGYIDTINGKVAVSWERREASVEVKVDVPENMEFIYKGNVLKSGCYDFLEKV